MRGASKIDTPRRRMLRGKLSAMQGGRCCYCAVEFDNNQFGDRYATIEHIQDRAKGGTNLQTNLAMACSGCNNRAEREQWSEPFKRSRIRTANVIALADLTVEAMELPPEYIEQCRSAAA